MPRVPRSSIDAWNHFLDQVSAARDRLGCPQGPDDGTGPGSTREEAWFRGLTNREHALLPSLFRRFPDPNGADWDAIWNLESDLFWEFSARASALHATVRSDWDYLFTMQHFLTPTRLLDWTEVFGIAIYFALLHHDPRNPDPPIPCVYVLNPYALNRESTDNPDSDLYAPDYLTAHDYADQLLQGGIGFDWPIAIYPRQSNPRLHAQRAWFTIHGNAFLPLEAMNYHRVLERVDIPIAAIPAAREFLEMAGINHFLLFGDLENLSRHLREKNRI